MISDYDVTRFMGLALAEAKQAFEEGEVPVGAIIVRGCKIIGRGHNQREKLNDPTAHAEIIAISAAAATIQDWRLIDCNLFVTKEPCVMCAGAIVNSRIPFVYYGVDDKTAGCCGSLYQLCREPRFQHQAVVIGGILSSQCQQILSEFFKRNRK